MALPTDELDAISKKLTFDPDYIRFRSVCKSWRLAAPKHPQLPWLNLYYLSRFGNSSTLASFYQFSFETNKITRAPVFLDSPLVSSFINNSTVCIGSSRGWLAFVNWVTSAMLLFNPLTNSSINLPNWSNILVFSSASSFYLTSDPSESLLDCFAVVYYFGLSYCKVGSNAWTKLAVNRGSIINHFCSYHGKHFIASKGHVFVCDFGPNSSVREIISVSLDDDDVTLDKEIEFMHSLLVESDEDLLFVLVYYISDFDSCYYRVLKLEVECHVPKSVEVKNLGNKALFLSGKIAFSLTSSKYPGCKENCIYRAFITEKEHPVQTLEVHNFEGPAKNMCIENDLPPLYEGYKCDWFLPSLLT